MPTPAVFPDDSSQYPSTYPPQQEDYKASYDDLIDEYASPYTRNSQHKTFAVETPSMMPGELRRGLSNSMAPKPSFASEYNSKHSDETSDDPVPRAYPPLPSTKEVDPRGYWQKVCPCVVFVQILLTNTL